MDSNRVHRQAVLQRGGSGGGGAPGALFDPRDNVPFAGRLRNGCMLHCMRGEHGHACRWGRMATQTKQTAAITLQSVRMPFAAACAHALPTRTGQRHGPDTCQVLVGCHRRQRQAAGAPYMHACHAMPCRALPCMRAQRGLLDDTRRRPPLRGLQVRCGGKHKHMAPSRHVSPQEAAQDNEASTPACTAVPFHTVPGPPGYG